MSILYSVVNHILHIDIYLNDFVTNYGFWTYLVLFLIIFCETGFVVTPFLPGDSLLFAAGSIAAQPGNSINCLYLFLLLTLASILGNQINFIIGRFIGPRVFTAKDSWLLHKKHLNSAQQFYQQHGGKTIILARFIPIIRTFAPFIAGIGTMNSIRFSIYNVSSAVLWIGSLLGLGYSLGSLSIVKEHFTVVIYSIIAFSLLPTIIAYCNNKQQRRTPLENE